MSGAEACQTYTLENLKDRSSHMGKSHEMTTCTTVKKTDDCHTKKDECCEPAGYGYGRRGWGYFWVWLIVIWIIVALILFLFQPDFLLNGDKENCGFGRGERCERGEKDDCCFNFGNLLLWSLGIAIVIVVLIWLFRGFGGGYGRGAYY